MKSFYLLLIFSLIIHATKAQSLVANGGFQDRNTCTEFHALCAPEAWFFIPTYVKSAHKEDTNHVEVLLRGSLFMATNYIYTKLLCPLQAGEQYTFSIWVRSNNDFDSLNVWAGPFEPGMNSIEITQASFTMTSQHVASTQDRWIKYTYTFTAAGDERFLMIGNLNVEVTYQPPRRMNATVKRPAKDPFYYIDNISLHNTSNPQKTCNEYLAIKRQVYDQNKRHPAGFIESVAIDKSLIKDADQTKKIISWVIVDTPPTAATIADTLIIPDILFKSNSSELNRSFTKKT